MNIDAERADQGGIVVNLGDTRKHISFPDARALRDALIRIVGVPSEDKH